MLTEYRRQELGISDMLHLRSHDLSGFLIGDLVVPKRVKLFENGGDAVVLSRPDEMHCGEVEILIGTIIT